MFTFSPMFRRPESYADLSQLQRQVDALFSDWLRPQQRRVAGPAFDVFDDGERYRLVADVPGMKAEDLEVEATEDGLAIRGTRKVEAPEGFSVHRREREALTLARSFAFPSKIDPEQVSATLQAGVLTITLGKRADAKPRSITVQSGAA
jgi:HSP20 family protein